MTKELKKYQSLIAPNVSWESITSNYGECTISPLESGFGATFGNTLRRILLGGIEGSAITSVIIEGVNNEFSVIPGVTEDTMRILLTIKQLVIKNETGEEGFLYLNKKGPGDVFAKDIKCDDHLKIINEDLKIATLANDGILNIKFFVESGRGYKKAGWQKDVILDLDNKIYIDSTFAPVRNVSFEVKKARVGKDIDYDKLQILITTDGTITPKEAFDYSVSVALNQFKSFISNENEEIIFSNKNKEIINTSSVKKSSIEKLERDLSMLSEDFSPELLLKSIDILGLPARAHNCLFSIGIQRIIDLVNMSEDEVMNIKNFGKKSYEDLLQIMKDFGLRFSMNIDEKQLISHMEKNNETSK
jgi:DNA-directed RNA polymerase subunit alpha